MGSTAKTGSGCALGVFNIMCDALRRHNRDPQNGGRPARRFVVHQWVFNELCREISLQLDFARYLQYTDGVYRFMGTPILIDLKAQQAYLLGFNNETIFL